MTKLITIHKDNQSYHVKLMIHLAVIKNIISFKEANELLSTGHDDLTQSQLETVEAIQAFIDQELEEQPYKY